MGRCTDLAGHSVWAQLPESQGWLDASQQGNHIQVLDAASGEGGGGREALLGWRYPLWSLLKALPAHHSLAPPTPHSLPGKNWRAVSGGRGKGRGQGQWEPWDIYFLGNGRHRSEVPELEDCEAVHCPLVSQVWGQRAYLAPGSYSDQILLNSSR